MKGIGLDVPEWFANLFFGMRNFTETVIRLNPVLFNLTKKSKTRKGVKSPKFPEMFLYVC
jgi:hypothetical protein